MKNIVKVMMTGLLAGAVILAIDASCGSCGSCGRSKKNNNAPKASVSKFACSPSCDKNKCGRGNCCK